MESAKRQSVLNERLAFRMGVGDDVSRIEQLLVTKFAEGALAAVGIQHAPAECPLMESYPDRRGHVGAA
jgi:hypothetical protein